MKKHYNHLIRCLTIVFFTCQIQAVVADSKGEEWQQRRLMQPTVEELDWEQAGHIMIYDGLSDRQVTAAMDRHFSRIQSMMFTRTLVTDAQGAPQTDPVTGEIVTENDGCD